MSRFSFFTRRRLLALAGTTCGAAAVGTTGFWFWMRNCRFEEFGPETDNLFRHPFLKQVNPWNKPDSHDMCVRRVPLSQLKPELLQDAQHGGSKLVEHFCAGMWGGYGYAIQRRIMQTFRDETNKEDLWTKEELLNSSYEPGTFITHHFVVLEKTAQSLTFRACIGPRQAPPVPMQMDTLFELRVDLDKEKQIAEFRMKCMAFDGTKGASEEPDPYGGVAGWLHRQYVTLLVEAAVGNCTR